MHQLDENLVSFSPSDQLDGIVGVDFLIISDGVRDQRGGRQVLQFQRRGGRLKDLFDGFFVIGRSAWAGQGNLVTGLIGNSAPRKKCDAQQDN